MKTQITAVYHARLRIVYVKPYSEPRRRALFDMIHDCSQTLGHDENSEWFGHSKRVMVHFASRNREYLERAVTPLEDKVEASRSVKLETEDNAA